MDIVHAVKCFDCGFQPFQMSFDRHTMDHADNKTKDTTRSTSAFDWAAAGNARPVKVDGTGDERDLTNRSQKGISIPLHQDHILSTTQRHVQALPPEPAMSAPTMQRKVEGKIVNAEMYLASLHHWTTLPSATRPPDPSQEAKGRQDRMKNELTEKTQVQGAEHGQQEECSEQLQQQQVVSRAESESGVTGSMATEGAAAVEEDGIGQLVGASHKHVMSRQTNVECQTADGANDADEKEPKSNEKETSAALIQTECCNLATLELDPVCMTGSSLTTTAFARPTADHPGTLKIGSAVLQATEFTDALQAAREDEVRRMQQHEEKLITTLKKRGYSGFHPEDLALTILPSQESQSL